MALVRVVDCYAIVMTGPSRRGSSPLRIPEAGPSWEYLSSERHIVTRPSETGILPLQRYRSVADFNQRSRKSQRQYASPLSGTSQETPMDNSEIVEYLTKVAQNPTRFNISRTSQTLLSSLDTLSSDQREQLVHRIQMDHGATQPVPEEALEIIYCDAHICVTNKPSGVLSVPGPRQNPSLANLVYDTIRPPNLDLDQMVVHRLDMATSGILVYALSLEALTQLHSDFKERRVQKTYQALVALDSNGQSTLGTTQEGEITVDLERDPENPPFMRIAQPRDDERDGVGVFGERSMTHKFFRQAPKECLTTWTLVRREVYQGQRVARLDLRPWTGRTHQLRVHCAKGLGAPIVGDNIYGIETLDTSSATPSHLCLHARQLCLYHPISGAPMIFEADPPF